MMSFTNTICITKQLLTVTLVVALTSGPFVGQLPGQAPDLEKNLPPQAKPRVTNSIGMSMATIDAGTFQMGAPEYVVQVSIFQERS